MSNLGFVFAAGEAKYGEQGLFLSRSIRQTNPDASIYIFVPDSESPDHLSELERYGTILTGPQRLPNYGISTKIDALAAAESVANEEYLLLLDTDTVVLDEISVHKQAGELFLKPVDIGLQYWGRESQSSNEWAALAAKLDVSVPKWEYTSTFDGNPIPPYWNAGFVLTANNGFGSQWMEAVESVYPDLSYEWHADQVTLGLLSQEYDTVPLKEPYNYPLHLRLRVSDNAKVLHYHNFSNLNKANQYKELFQSIGIWDIIRSQEYSYLHGSWRYLKRKYLPMNERHVIERLYEGLLGP